MGSAKLWIWLRSGAKPSLRGAFNCEVLPEPTVKAQARGGGKLPTDGTCPMAWQAHHQLLACSKWGPTRSPLPRLAGTREIHES